jgi:hypothetical protein
MVGMESAALAKVRSLWRAAGSAGSYALIELCPEKACWSQSRGDKTSAVSVAIGDDFHH